MTSVESDLHKHLCKSYEKVKSRKSLQDTLPLFFNFTVSFFLTVGLSFTKIVEDLVDLFLTRTFLTVDTSNKTILVRGFFDSFLLNIIYWLVRTHWTLYTYATIKKE